ncbi:hypothetical protein [Aneurinibacillus terranovensis]|uniref:hypothetical protein n=1 Tax=Aneurinibacillus terranovensis TaxID=278991 RepID=UPI0004828455|nr:hypothetical protein [Aneurinibacillus terranovensis]
MNFLMEYKWAILAVLEVLAWSATFFMFYARYRMKSKVWFRVSVVLLAITGVIPQVVMGIINFVMMKKLDLFTLVIVLLILYGSTIGKKQVKKLDVWVQSRFSKSA